MTTLLVVIPIVLLVATFGVLALLLHVERGSGDRLAHRRNEQPLAHELPYWALLDAPGHGVVVNVDGTYSAAYELRGIDTDCLDDEALNQVANALHGVLLNLPSGTVAQVLFSTDGDVADLVERYRASARGRSAVGQRLVDAKAEELRATRGLRRSRLVLVLSAPNARNAAAERVPFLKQLLQLLRPSLTWSAAQHEASLRAVRSIGEQAARGLEAAGLRARALSRPELRTLAYGLLNPGRTDAVATPGDDAWWAEPQTAREQLAFTGVHVEKDHLVVGDQLVRVVTLKGLPTTTHPAMVERLMVELPFFFRLAYSVELLDSTSTMDELRRRRDQATTLATLRQSRNQEAEAQAGALSELIDKTLQASVCMTQLGLTVVLSVDRRHANAIEILDQQGAEVLRVVSALQGAQALVDEYMQLDEWLATLPGNARHSIRRRRCTSENAVHLLPAWQTSTGSSDPKVMLHSGRGHLVGLDPFNPELDNPNAFMAGASGSGKSVTTNYLLLNMLATGAGALILDVGGSYRRLLEIFGGTYFEIGNGQHAINPFFEPADIVRSDGTLEEQRAQLLAAVIERMVCDGGRDQLRNVERAVVATAIADTYRRSPRKAPLLSDFVAVLKAFRGDAEDVAIASALARDLRVWTEGPFGRLINRPSTVQLTTTCAAFDLKGVDTQPHLRDVVVLILSGIIWNMVMRDRAPKAVVFDEVWKFLATPKSAELIAELYRTSRKYNCSILTISQSVEDFTGSAIAPALVNNSATTYLLRQRRGHDVVAAQFKLNDRELAIFRDLQMRRGEYTECLVLHGDHHFLGRVVLTPLEYWIATTFPGDLQLERRIQAQYPQLSRLELLERLAALYPSGAPRDNAPAEVAA
jgi:type IV secretory pathway VirB4 component